MKTDRAWCALQRNTHATSVCVLCGCGSNEPPNHCAYYVTVHNGRNMVFPLSYVHPTDPAWTGAIVVAPVGDDGLPRGAVVCWNDTEPFEGAAVQLPEHHHPDSGSTVGDAETVSFCGATCFCSWACAMRWAQDHIPDHRYRELRSTVYAITGSFVTPAPDPFATMAKFVGPEGLTVDEYRRAATDGRTVTTVSLAVVPGHKVVFWDAPQQPPTGIRSTTTPSMQGRVPIAPTLVGTRTDTKRGESTRPRAEIAAFGAGAGAGSGAGTFTTMRVDCDAVHQGPFTSVPAAYRRAQSRDGA